MWSLAQGVFHVRVLSTAKDQAVFYANVADAPARGSVVAEGWAAEFGGETLEMVLRRTRRELPEFDASDDFIVKAWERASVEFAENASGRVRVLTRDLEPRSNSTFWEFELPALRDNPLVDEVIAVDPVTRLERVIHTKNP